MTQKLLKSSEISSSSFNLDKTIQQLSKCEYIPESSIISLFGKALEILVEESNVVRVNAPVIICGDIHGQFYDLLELFKAGGKIPTQNYLFLGDYVDRGYYSIPTFLYLIAMKVKYPSHITLIRGNHESRQISQHMGFYDESLRQYGTASVWRYMTDLFDYLPIAAIVGNQLFCVHGGLSPEINTIDPLNIIDRKQEVPHEGAMCDIMWSDPETDIDGWAISPRGAGYLFGKKIAKKFLKTNKFSKLVRAHQLVMEGYKHMFDNTVITVWSAPNYCYRCGNVASVMKLDYELNITFKIFEAAENENRGAKNFEECVPQYFL